MLSFKCLGRERMLGGLSVNVALCPCDPWLKLRLKGSDGPKDDFQKTRALGLMMHEPSYLLPSRLSWDLPCGATGHAGMTSVRSKPLA